VPPSTVEVTSAVFVRERSADGIVEEGVATVIVTVELLFPKFGSVEDAVSVAEAMFAICVPDEAFTRAAIWRVALELALMLPIVQAPDVAYVPLLAVAFTKVRPAGRVSVATTPVEVAGPRAETVTV